MSDDTSDDSTSSTSQLTDGKEAALSKRRANSKKVEGGKVQKGKSNESSESSSEGYGVIRPSAKADPSTSEGNTDKSESNND